jgi:hypothetical protein
MRLCLGLRHAVKRGALLKAMKVCRWASWLQRSPVINNSPYALGSVLYLLNSSQAY